MAAIISSHWLVLWLLMESSSRTRVLKYAKVVENVCNGAYISNRISRKSIWYSMTFAWTILYGKSILECLIFEISLRSRSLNIPSRCISHFCRIGETWASINKVSTIWTAHCSVYSQYRTPLSASMRIDFEYMDTLSSVSCQ